MSTSLTGLTFNYYSTSGATDFSNVQKWAGIVKLRAMFFFQATAPYRDARGWCNHFVKQMYEGDVAFVRHRKRHSCILIMTFYAFGGS